MTYHQALQAALGAEHAALYVLGVLGGQTSQSDEPGLFASLDAAFVTHRMLRDRLGATLREEGLEPEAAEAAYEVVGELSSSQAVAVEALRVEHGCASSWAWLVENSLPARRAWPVEVLNETAVRELVFRGAPEMLPGSTEHADR